MTVLDRVKVVAGVVEPEGEGEEELVEGVQGAAVS